MSPQWPRYSISHVEELPQKLLYAGLYSSLPNGYVFSLTNCLMAAAAVGICTVRKWMSQSTSSSRIMTDSKSVERNHRSAFKCPSHASALPLDIRLSLSARSLVTSSSVHFGWAGIVISISVIFAANMRPSRRGDPSLDTATTAPNYYHCQWRGLSYIKQLHRQAQTYPKSRVRRGESMRVDSECSIVLPWYSSGSPTIPRCRISILPAPVEYNRNAKEQNHQERSLRAPVHCCAGARSPNDHDCITRRKGHQTQALQIVVITLPPAADIRPTLEDYSRDRCSSTSGHWHRGVRVWLRSI